MGPGERPGERTRNASGVDGEATVDPGGWNRPALIRVEPPGFDTGGTARLCRGWNRLAQMRVATFACMLSNDGMSTTRERPNILFLLSDEHSYRAMGHLDPTGEGEPVDTPTFDRLARQGVRLHQTYCQVPLCTPSRICMLTGKSPMESGGWFNSCMLHPDRPTIASTLAEAGYETCLVGKMHLGGNRQYVGFQHRPYGDITGRTGHQWEPLAREGGNEMRSRTVDAGVTEIPESQLQEQIIARESLAFLREHRAAHPDQPWFLCASFSRPHFPLTAPKRWLDRYWPDGVTPPKVGRTGDTAQHPMTQGMAKGFRTEEIDPDEAMHARAAYFACVSYLDELIGDFLTNLDHAGLLENTIVVYTSDHGELMGEHGMWWKNSWHEGASRVPWLIQLPEHRTGELGSATVETPVSLADLYPTLCGFAGVEAPDDLDGVDLSSQIRGGDESQRGPVWFTNPTPRWGEGAEHVVVRDGDFKFVRFRGMEPNLLFNLADDPLEQRNIIADHPEVAERLSQFVDEVWDFDEASRRAEAHVQESRSLVPQLDHAKLDHAKNLYHTPRGVLIDADTPLYHPRVIVEDPGEVFADAPNRPSGVSS